MNVDVVYAAPSPPLLLTCRVSDGATVAQVIEQSGVLRCCPEINLQVQKVGIFGKFVKLDSTLREGDRVEIYQRITRVIDDDEDDDDEE